LVVRSRGCFRTSVIGANAGLDAAINDIIVKFMQSPVVAPDGLGQRHLPM